jgi:hypothetical protein
VLLARFSRVTVLTLKLSQGERIPVPLTAWSHKTAPTFAACVALARRHLWRARSVVNSATEPEFAPWPWETLEVLLQGFP